MKLALPFLIALTAIMVSGCAQQEAGPPKQPEVEVKTMEEIGKKTPEQEAAEIRQNDQRAPEDKAEGGI